MRHLQKTPADKWYMMRLVARQRVYEQMFHQVYPVMGYDVYKYLDRELPTELYSLLFPQIHTRLVSQ